MMKQKTEDRKQKELLLHAAALVFFGKHFSRAGLAKRTHILYNEQDSRGLHLPLRPRIEKNRRPFAASAVETEREFFF